ncbi:MAG TPA: serine/threonine-protein kinase [Polyangiaceae bacterium]|nr:serine/threonine-protein kinase [Polyangiaceae bacterium]
MASIAEPAELSEGTRLLDRYVIIDRVAGGGMASIYRATDERLQRIVCVKLLRLVLEAGSTSGSSVYQATYEHFLQEALALSRLHHPHTLKIYDFGYLEDSGRPFQISEFLDGGNLEQLVKREGPVLPSDLLAILEPVGGAIAEAHEAGIIHRDIKPSNILFARIGRGLVPKLADFGIAHSSDVRRRQTDEDDEPVSVVTLFSPRWAAPEQLAGAASGQATDVYSYALVTAFMLAGHAMFESREVRATFPERVMGDRLVTRRLGEMGIAPPLMPPLLHALAARIVDRTPTITQFVQEMRAAIDSMNAFPGGAPRRRLPSEPTATFSTLSARIHPDAAVEEPGPLADELVASGMRTRVIDVEDRLDLAVPTPLGVDARIRLMLLPGRTGYRLNVKGLNCFVVRDGRPAAAVVVESDGVVELMSSAREPMGRLGYTFGVVEGNTRVFPAFAPDLVLPLPRGARAIAVHVEATGELIAMCAKSP